MKNNLSSAALITALLFSACGDLPVTPDLGRQTLNAQDGWGAATSGTTGGATANSEHIFTVTNRAELINALGNGDATPKIIYVKGLINANVDDENQPLTCADYAAPGYTLNAYLNAYDPATWGRTKKPSGTLEDARKASQVNQARRMKINISPNTSIIGLGRNSGFIGTSLMIEKVDNVILRNLVIQDAADCFPAWDPTDGASGNWNSEYDLVSVVTATHVWVNQVAFSDGDNLDANQPLYFGRPYQVHDGALDITKGADYVTASWNVFENHDKTMLIGSTNSPGTAGSATSDVGKLRVTLHHNRFTNVGQRIPRVRFGQVHVYNNLYEVTDPHQFVYGWGVGVESQLYAHHNYFELGSVQPDQIIYNWGGKQIYAADNMVKNQAGSSVVDLVAAFNAVNDPDLPNTASWTPALVAELTPVQDVPALVRAKAGPR